MSYYPTTFFSTVFLKDNIKEGGGHVWVFNTPHKIGKGYLLLIRKSSRKSQEHELEISL